MTPLLPKLKQEAIERFEKRFTTRSTTTYFGQIFDPDPDPRDVTGFISHELDRAFEAVREEILKNGHGGGNWRRLIEMVLTPEPQGKI